MDCDYPQELENNLSVFQYVSDEASLNAIVAQYQQSPLLVLDTEFVRTRTYYAKLGLIQAYDGKTLALIDPVALPDLSVFGLCWIIQTLLNWCIPVVRI